MNNIRPLFLLVTALFVSLTVIGCSDDKPAAESKKTVSKAAATEAAAATEEVVLSDAEEAKIVQEVKAEVTEDNADAVAAALLKEIEADLAAY